MFLRGSTLARQPSWASCRTAAQGPILGVTCSARRRSAAVRYSERPEDGLLASVNVPALTPSDIGADKPGKALLDLSTRISNSYAVLQGCPWVAPRPIYVLAVSSEWLGSDQASMYMVQAKVALDSTSDELSSVLGGYTMEVSALRDGVVAFDRLQDAEAFSVQLQDELRCEAFVATFDSHELFRIVGEVDGVVIHLSGSTDFVPTPAQLTAYVCGGSA